MSAEQLLHLQSTLGLQGTQGTGAHHWNVKHLEIPEHAKYSHRSFF